MHAESATLKPTNAQYTACPASLAASFRIELGVWSELITGSSTSGKLSKGILSKLFGVIAWATNSGNKWGKK